MSRRTDECYASQCNAARGKSGCPVRRWAGRSGAAPLLRDGPSTTTRERRSRRRSTSSSCRARPSERLSRWLARRILFVLFDGDPTDALPADISRQAAALREAASSSLPARSPRTPSPRRGASTFVPRMGGHPDARRLSFRADVTPRAR